MFFSVPLFSCSRATRPFCTIPTNCSKVFYIAGTFRCRHSFTQNSPFKWLIPFIFWFDDFFSSRCVCETSFGQMKNCRSAFYGSVRHFALKQSVQPYRMHSLFSKFIVILITNLVGIFVWFKHPCIIAWRKIFHQNLRTKKVIHPRVCI